MRWRGALVALALGCAAKVGGPVSGIDVTMVEEEPVKHAWLDQEVRRIDVDGTTLAVMDTGADGPPVLLVHGLGFTSSLWEYQLDSPLGEQARLIAPDLPGWGLSDQPDGPYTPSWYATHLVGLLDALGLDRATVVGHSMGAQAAIMMALEHPSRVERLVLVAPAGVETFTPEEAALLGGFWTVERLRARTPAEARQAYAFVFSDFDAGVERLLAERLAIDETPRFDGMARAVLRSIQGMLDEPVRARLGEITVPTLIVFGAADAMIPNRALHPDLTVDSLGHEAKTAIPGAQLVLIEGAGHTPYHDDPEAFASALRRFMALLPPGDP